MDQVTVTANLAALGLAKGATVTVAETPMVAGAINSGVLTLVERHTAAVPPETGGTEQVGQPPVSDETPPEVAADNSTVVPSHQDGTRPRG